MTVGPGLYVRNAADEWELQPPDSGVVRFPFTGAPAYFTVPPNITLLRVIAAGAGGGQQLISGTAPASAALGGLVQCDLTVTPGEVLEVRVGQRPLVGTSGAAPGGYNGGGNGGSAGSTVTIAGGGGGASDIRRSPYALADRLVVGPGGGGSGSNDSIRTGGNGATPTGAAGLNGLAGVGSTPTGGGGGTSGAGGAAGSTSGSPAAVATAGALGQGGTGASSDVNGRDGGGGGGGLYGGGGGGGSTFTSASGAGGGGGSGLSTGVNEVLGTNDGHGFVQIEWGD